MTDEFYSRHCRTDLQCGPIRLHMESHVATSKPPRRRGVFVRMLVILLTVVLCPVDEVRRAVLLDRVVSEAPAFSASQGAHSSGPASAATSLLSGLIPVAPDGKPAVRGMFGVEPGGRRVEATARRDPARLCGESIACLEAVARRNRSGKAARTSSTHWGPLRG